MRKLIGLVAAALIAAVPAPAYCCLNGVYIIEDRDIRELADAERLLVAGRYREALAAIETYDVWNDEFEGAQVAAFLRRARLLDATASLRLIAQRKPIPQEPLATAVRRLRFLQADDGRTAPLIKARLAEALALTPGGMPEAKLLISDLEKRDVIPEPEAWVTVAKVRAYLRDVDGMSAALRRCEQMAGKRKHVCRAGGLTS